MTELAEAGRGVVEPRRLRPAAQPAPARPFDFAVDGEDFAADNPPRPLDALHAELIAGAGAAVLLVALAFLPWFDVGRPAGPVASSASARGGSGVAASLTTVIGSEGGWQALGWLRWIALVAIAAALLPLLARPARRWVGVPRATHPAVAALGGLTALLLGYRVLIGLPDPSRVIDQRAGAILGLLAALAIAVGGIEAVRAGASRARDRNGGARPDRTPGEAPRVTA